MLNLCVTFIKPILMFPDLEADDIPAGLQGLPVSFNVFWILFWESLL